MTDLRQNKVEDPYHLLKLAGYDLVLCSEKTPFSRWLKQDPRFNELKKVKNAQGEFTLYERLAKSPIASVQKWKVISGGTESLVDLHEGPTSQDFYFVKDPQGCVTLQVAEPPASTPEWIVISGRGQWEGVELSAEPQWSEWILKTPADWAQRAWRVCPRGQEPLSFGMFLLSKEQKVSWCKEASVVTGWRQPDVCAMKELKEIK